MNEKELIAKHKELVQLHNAYDKHEWVTHDKHWSNLYTCKTCGEMRQGDDKDPVSAYTILTNATDMSIDLLPKEFHGLIAKNIIKVLSTMGDGYRHESRLLQCVAVGKLLNKLSPTEMCNHKNMALKDSNFALMYTAATRTKDDEVFATLERDPLALLIAMEELKMPADDESRDIICCLPKYAIRYAKNIDKKPHPKTRSMAARNPNTAAQYAIDVDKSAKTKTARGTPLRTIVCRNLTAANEWEKEFGPFKRTATERKEACRTFYGAFNLAKNVEHKPSKIVSDMLVNSSSYGPAYAYSVLGKPLDGLQRTLSHLSWPALEYMLTFNLNGREFEYLGRSNFACSNVYRWWNKRHAITREQALKKSLLALVYVIHNDAYKDHEVVMRARKNRAWDWVLASVKSNRDDIKRLHSKEKVRRILKLKTNRAAVV